MTSLHAVYITGGLSLESTGRGSVLPPAGGEATRRGIFSTETAAHRRANTPCRQTYSLSPCLFASLSNYVLITYWLHTVRDCFFLAAQRNQCGIFYANVCPSVSPSVCHTFDSRLNGSGNRNMLRTTPPNDVSGFLRPNCSSEIKGGGFTPNECNKEKHIASTAKSWLILHDILEMLFDRMYKLVFFHK